MTLDNFQCLFEKKLLIETFSRLNNYNFEKVKKKIITLQLFHIDLLHYLIS